MKYREARSAGGTWQLRLFGKFSLFDPSGQAIDFRNRKCEGLVAVLALHRPNGAGRDLIANALWPEKPLTKRQESLRQALAIIRHSAGLEFVFSDRTHCGLAGNVHCDFDQPLLRTGTAFMPGQTTPWFEQVRLELALNSEVQEETSVMSHCLEFLRWSARCDPKGLYGFFRTNRYLVRGLPLREVKSILAAAGAPSGIVGWAEYWRGATEDNLDRCASYLRRALRTAAREQDWDLASEACLELGKVHARRGNVAGARAVVRAAREVAERSKDASAGMNCLRLEGTLLLHWGQRMRGLSMLRQSTDGIEDPVRRMVAESAQALFEVMSGRYESARNSLEIGERLSRETDHQQVSMLNTLTRALLSIHDGPRSTALPLLEATAARSYQSGTCQLGVYAEEVSAKLLLLGNEPAAARSKLGSAKRNRLQAHMARTPLEFKMVTAIG